MSISTLQLSIIIMEGEFAVILTLDNILKAMGYRDNGIPILRIQEKLCQQELEAIVPKKIRNLQVNGVTTSE